MLTSAMKRERWFLFMDTPRDKMGIAAGLAKALLQNPFTEIMRKFDSLKCFSNAYCEMAGGSQLVWPHPASNSLHRYSGAVSIRVALESQARKQEM